MARIPSKILWLHNFPDRNWGMFMWDILDGLRGRDIAIDEIALPTRPSLKSSFDLIRHVRSRAREYDLVHAQYGSLVGLIALLSGRPLILSLRGSDVYFHKERRLAATVGSAARVLFSYIAALGAVRIIVMSHRMARDVRRWPFMGGKVVVVITDPAGDIFWPGPAPYLETAPLRIFFGSLQADNTIKRRWLVDEAIALCRAVGISIDVDVVVGRPRSEVLTRMKACDVVALASTHEGWPNIIKEALICGLNFVATDVSDVAQLASEPASGNLIVEAQSESFALAFVQMSVSKAWRAADRDARYCNFRPETVALQHAIIYASVG